MYITHPTPRLRTAELGSKVYLHGDGSQREFTVMAVRDDGLYSLHHKGREVVVAIASHRIVK